MPKFNVVAQHDKVIKKLEQVAETITKIQENSTGDEFHPMQSPQFELAEAIANVMKAGYISIEDITEYLEE